MDEHEFRARVDAALHSIPDELWNEIDNVEIVVDDEAPGRPHLYGLYHGVPLTERSVWSSGGMPDSITIYRLPIVRDFGHDPALLERQIRITVLHEIGHYFGIDEDRLRALGYA
ncbi:MAG: metallopeptidase family protein [Thermoleophilia bacterium]|nr:metallopeptidase family protein [Thermoleophilia bacterium]